MTYRLRKIRPGGDSASRITWLAENGDGSHYFTCFYQDSKTFVQRAEATDLWDKLKDGLMVLPNESIQLISVDVEVASILSAKYLGG